MSPSSSTHKDNSLPHPPSHEECLDLMMNAPIGIFKSTPDGRLLSANTVLAKRLGYETAEELVASVTDIAGQIYAVPEEREEFRRLLLKHGQVMNYEFRGRCRDGTVIWASMNARVVKDQLRDELYFQGFITDVTERKQAEEERELLQAQLFQAQKMESMGILAGGVAHDFNNLLQTMGGNIQFLLMNKHKHHPDADRLKAVARSIDRASRLVRQLLLFSRKAEFQRRRMDLNHVVGNAAMILERAIPRMVDIELHLEDRLWPINADFVQIEQVLLNLGVNAANAMSDGGRLVIKTSNVVLDEDFVRTHMGANRGDHVLLSVSDTGKGMDKETLAHIFDPFFTGKEVDKNTGLGLASVYGIVVGHGGYIQCTSESGQGTTFNIYWPVIQDQSVVEAEGPGSKIVSLFGTETILVVDDDMDIRQLTQEALEACGYKVLAAASAEEALIVYADKGQSIHLVVLDLNMPDMGGQECLNELLRIDPEARVLIASGYSAAGQAKGVLEAVAGFVEKPYRFEELLAKVREVLNG